MHAAYVACLFAGALATVLFVVLGVASAGSHGHAGHHSLPGAKGGHTPHGHAAHGHASHPGETGSRLAESVGWIASWLSPLTVAAAALWFGAAGLLAEGALERGSLMVAAAAAVVGAAIVRSVFLAFVRASTPPLGASAVGAVGTVNATIRADAPGEVVVTLEGLHRSIPARSADGQFIPRGTAVAIVERKGGFALVTPLDPLDAGAEQVDMLAGVTKDGADNNGGTGISPPERKNQ